MQRCCDAIASQVKGWLTIQAASHSSFAFAADNDSRASLIFLLSLILAI
jgi:hypothetical protein